nr:uncharacterized protein LOC103352177 [Oryctolagus cuniculus]
MSAPPSWDILPPAGPVLVHLTMEALWMSSSLTRLLVKVVASEEALTSCVSSPQTISGWDPGIFTNQACSRELQQMS